MSIKIHEIFFSLQGEASRVGLPTVFVRLTGCPLRCGYCDTAYAFHGGDLFTVNEIMTQVAEFGVKRVTVTGGEPLAQKECLVLLKTLCDNDYDVSLETSGAMDITHVDERVSVILDVKTPGSGEESKNLWSNIPLLKPKDEVKFVLCDQTDYAWAKQVLHERGIQEICPVLFSPVYGQLQPHDLAEWILEDKLQVRLQVQLHKILWGEVAGK
ncbi:MAG TPA: 7-carboxy-7-deazaguanine synthase QueE [Methylophilaceae bacterium]